ncbi:MAG: dihydropteroate synthase [Thermoguttaceae bacterium]|nr:dihydropteroate synthase [Thermoguttaceae bacterium]
MIDPLCLWSLKTVELDLRAPLIMAILNATPDSFSDGGRFADQVSERFQVDVERVVAAANEAVRAGADILDVGGESTRPGSDPVGEAEELRRAIPVVRALKERVGAPISVDTYRPAVAAEALDAGAEIVNDVSAGRFIGEPDRFAAEDEDFPEEMAEVVASRGAGVVLCHMRGKPKTMQTEGLDPDRDLVWEARSFLSDRMLRMRERGVPFRKMAVDPGLGFGATFEQNWDLMVNVDQIVMFPPVPIVVGASRKSFIKEALRRFGEDLSLEPGTLLDPSNKDALDFATALTSVFASRRLPRILRVHNVAATSFALSAANAFEKSPD